MAFDSPLPPFNANDPHASFLNSSCFDLLLIELVPMSYRLSSEASAIGCTAHRAIEEDEQKESASRRLELLGYRVGQGMVERSGLTSLL
jgi:hypothetical protein